MISYMIITLNILAMIFVVLTIVEARRDFAKYDAILKENKGLRGIIQELSHKTSGYEPGHHTDMGDAEAFPLLANVYVTGHPAENWDDPRDYSITGLSMTGCELPPTLKHTTDGEKNDI